MNRRNLIKLLAITLLCVSSVHAQTASGQAPFTILVTNDDGYNAPGIRAIAASEGMIIAAETTGKYKMALQVVGIILLILEGTGLAELGNMHLAGIVTLYLSLVFGYISGGQYVWSFWKQVVAKGL